MAIAISLRISKLEYSATRTTFLNGKIHFRVFAFVMWRKTDNIKEWPCTQGYM